MRCVACSCPWGAAVTLSCATAGVCRRVPLIRAGSIRQRGRYNRGPMSELSIAIRGHGPRQVVLLHGWALQGAIFAPLVTALETRCTLHVVDLPGHGASRDSSVPLTPVACARAIAAATPPAVWLGWSLGGLIALQAALDHPHAVRALGVVDAAPCFVAKPDWSLGVAPAVFRDFGADLGAHWRVAVERFLALEALGSAGARRAAEALRPPVLAGGAPAPRALTEGIACVEDTDLRARLGELAMPSAWIAGARDRLVPWQAVAWAAAQCHGHFTRIEHAGHAPFIGFTDAVVAALEPLLEGLA